MVPLISAEDALSQDKRLFLDLRPNYSDFSNAHIKSSYYMSPQDSSNFELYAEFLSLYHETYPESLILFIGSKTYLGNDFVNRLLLHSGYVIGKMAIVRGGFDALALESP